jgi:hypothetical protein
MTDLPDEAKRLLAAAPEDFVAERNRVAGELRQAGRAEDARAVADLRKPTAVVLAVNRAARDRPQAARDAARAAEKLAKTQLSGDPEKYGQAQRDLESALALLAEVAVAQLSRKKPATEAMRRRVVDTLRASVAESATRKGLELGVLQEESETAGFGAFTGMTVPAARRPRAKGPTKEEHRESEKRDRERRLRDELSQAEKALAAAERAVATAERERDKAARAVASATKKLERAQAD